MVFEHIDQLKQEYTDKYVVVDQRRPELRRFEGMTGVVKTVNMSGRALVEFDGHNDIGWYDIDPRYLNVIDQPLPKPEPKKEKPAKPAAKKAAPAAPAPKKPAPEKAKAGGKMSMDEMLAAARAEKSAGAKPAEKPVAEKTPTETPAEKPAAEKPKPASPKQMGVEEMLAAARAEKAGGGKTPPAPGAEAPAKQTPEESSGQPAPPTASQKDPSKMSVAEILAAARKDKASGAPVADEPEPAAPAEPKPRGEAVGSASSVSTSDGRGEPGEAELEDAEEPTASSTGGSKKDEITNTADILTYCRKVDG